ncbi:type IA DNA topoisomerase [Enterococcus faecium]|uniref:type IA DNA topoisomerase n=1 Tax=Enterococcus faecium TaxID=1352 RepID=UPI00177E0187|nr:type IA DNA topoisomerase [Enterococcus faecium]MBD9712097.1 topoisomerase DNA-binding C4 zinc finger domain-containing protein [Enterococcus faecium]MBD9748518.1 topoisomerase DNA-binding C4 zinc finger domain-containing protein [Enterococcus faecium]MBD9782158.1 topoisomerase DNA-binding C4 zinc finger domain-containing protein [Enterococcus faecium]
MSTVILAEKPSQALAYASALKQSTKKDGYFEIKDPLFTDETFITFGFGHLVELAEPGHYDEKWQNWKLESLPIFPDRYDFEVATDKKKQFKIVAELLKKANTIIVATDSDREGENIAWSIIHKANAFSKDKTFKRLWINSLEKDVIRSGFQNLQPGMNYYPFYQEAQTRQIADWLIGMNASPLYTLNLQQKGVQGTFSLGRVQTPTLYLIFQRQEAIENFKKEPFFEVEASIKVNQGSFKGVLSPTQRFKTQEELLAFVSSKQAIEALKQKEYIQVIKNKLVVTEKGKLLCQAVESQHLLTSAEMTAKWETYLKKIGKREGNQENFITNIKKFIVHLLEAVPNDIEKLNFSDYQEQKEKEAEKSIVGKCPKCGNNIVLKKSFYGCSNYPECKFTLAEHFRKKKLTKTNVKELLEGKETLVKGIKNKEKKPYNAVVKIGEKGYIDFISFSK